MLSVRVRVGVKVKVRARFSTLRLIDLVRVR